MSRPCKKKDSFCEPILGIPRGPTKSPTYRNKILSHVFKKELLYRMVKRNGRTMFLVVVPEAAQNELLRAAYDDSGHRGISRTFARLHDKYYWQKSIIDVADHCLSSPSCQKKKTSNLQPAGFLQPIQNEERSTVPYNRNGLHGTVRTSSRRNKYL